MTEAAGPARAVVAAGARLQTAAREMRDFAVESFRSFLGSRGAFSGVLFALLPSGAMCLGLALQSNLAVELGMKDDEVAWLNVGSTVVNGIFCVIGGWLSDRYGRRRMLAIFIAVQSLPVLYLMNELARHGWVMPVNVDAPNRPAVPGALVTALWVASLAFHAGNGLMYGTRSAAFMDVTNPRVAATQFTAYMAMLNLTIAYTANWQGIAAEAWGYPTTLLIDALFGLVGLSLLPFMKPIATAAFGQWTDAHAGRRARVVALALSVLCLCWVPYSLWHDVFGAAQPIAGTLFTLVFVASALYLLAGAAVIGDAAPRLSRVAVWLAPLLLLMHARYWVDGIARGLSGVVAPATVKAMAPGVFAVIAVAGAIALLLYARQSWRQLGAGIVVEGAVGQPA